MYQCQLASSAAYLTNSQISTAKGAMTATADPARWLILR